MDNIYSVSQLNFQVKNLLEGQFNSIWLTGEISNFMRATSGHWYFSLKDENAQISCAMFRFRNQTVRFQPQNGMQVIVRATVSLYEPRGDYQLRIDVMQPAGEGLLQQKFEQLKSKLSAEGLFAQNLKKMLPHFCKTVGVITSAQGAALQDILKILKRRDPSLKVVIYPAAVQGNTATAEIVEMIRLANIRREVEVLIVGRGGGSLEDLWCFNEEIVARAIFNSHLPVISAVGHETDVTIADFVADVRAATPSAAAELVSRNQQELQDKLRHQQQYLEMAFDRYFQLKQQKYQSLNLRLQNQHPQAKLSSYAEKLKQLNIYLQGIISRKIEQSRYQLTLVNNRLNNTDRLFHSSKLQLQALSSRLQQQHPKAQLQQQEQRLHFLEKHLQQHIVQLIKNEQTKIQFLHTRLNNHPLPQYVQHHQQQLKTLLEKLSQQNNQILQKKNHQYAELCAKLESLSPLKVLARGYSITQNTQGQTITHPNQVKVGDKITTKIHLGEIMSKVIKVNES